MNLCDDKIEDDSEIASEENNEDNEEESENSANILVCIYISQTRRVLFGPSFLSRQEKMGFLYAMKWISRFVLFVKKSFR